MFLDGSENTKIPKTSSAKPLLSLSASELSLRSKTGMPPFLVLSMVPTLKSQSCRSGKNMPGHLAVPGGVADTDFQGEGNAASPSSSSTLAVASASDPTKTEQNDSTDRGRRLGKQQNKNKNNQCQDERSSSTRKIGWTLLLCEGQHKSMEHGACMTEHETVMPAGLQEQSEVPHAHVSQGYVHGKMQLLASCM
jgi:hypothetical protein